MDRGVGGIEPTVTAYETDLLSELVRGKRSCLVQLRDMGRRQLELIDDSEMTRLLDLLALKQRTIEQLQRFERALDRFRGQDPDARRWRSPEQRQQCADEMRQCEALLAEIMGQEKYGEALLVRRRDEAAVRLQGAHVAAQARGAYIPETPINISQLDLSTS